MHLRGLCGRPVVVPSSVRIRGKGPTQEGDGRPRRSKNSGTGVRSGSVI